ncbi:hypothetical protein Tco_0178114 [Tanacetum coccineum]
MDNHVMAFIVISVCASTGNSFAYDPNPNSFDDSQNLSDYPPQPQYQTYSCELCWNDAHYGYDYPPQVPFVYNQDPCFNQNFVDFPQTSPSVPQQFLCCENCQAWDKFFEVKHAQSEEVQELLNKLLQDLQSINEELAEYINTPSWNLPTSSYDDDDDEYSFATQDYLLTCSTAITPDSPKTDSLIMSSVENLVQNPSESEDVSNGECDVLDYDDSQTTNISTYSNPLFDDSTYVMTPHRVSEFNPIHNEDPDSTPENDRFDTESYLLESLINRDTFMTFSPKIDFLLEEFADELALFKPSSPGINEADYDLEEEICRVERLLYDNSSPRPPEELNVENSIESVFSFSYPRLRIIMTHFIRGIDFVCFDEFHTTGYCIVILGLRRG